jgi:hypothetical protein
VSTQCLRESRARDESAANSRQPALASELLKAGIMTSKLIALALVLGTIVPSALGCARDAKPSCGLPCIEAARTGKLLHRAWGSGDADVWAVGLAGTIAHYDGEQWSTVESGTDETLFGVWGSSAKDVWAVGAHDTVLHFDGSAWTAAKAGSGKELHAVFGTASDDVWAVGAGGVAVHFDGHAWTKFETGTTEGLYAVHGTKNNLWSVGTNGTVAHYDGSQWLSSRVSDHPLYDVVVGSTSTWAVGYGTVLRFNGSSWSEVAAPQGDFVSVVAAREDDVWVAGFSDEVLHWNGKDWNAYASGSGGFQAMVANWAFTSDGRIVSWGRP